MNDEPAMLCYTDLVKLCDSQRQRIESLELAIVAVCEEIDHGASVTVARSMLLSAIERTELIE